MTTSLPLAARIVSLTDESATVRTLVLDRSLAAEPGQFVMAWLPGVDEKPFSLVDAGPVTLTIARVGPFTTAVHALQVGDPLWLRGPLGHGFTLPHGEPKVVARSVIARSDSDAPVPHLSRGTVSEGKDGVRGKAIPKPAEGDCFASLAMTVKRECNSRDGEPQTADGDRPAILLIAGGYGVAPLHFLARRGLAAGWQVSAVIGARTAAEVIFDRRLAALGVEVHVTTDDGSSGERGLATEEAERLLTARQAGRFRVLYACGPEPMLAAADRLSQAYNLPAQLSYERTMRCGFGVCGTCAREGWLVCRDGPVKALRSGDFSRSRAENHGQ
jgi:NAD(P)H-flavin reductase